MKFVMESLRSNTESFDDEVCDILVVLNCVSCRDVRFVVTRLAAYKTLYRRRLVFSTFSSCSQMLVVFYHSAIHGLVGLDTILQA